jgi:hypothetical protein
MGNLMKKTNLLFITYCLLLVVLLSLFAKNSFAATSNVSLFNLSNIVLQQKLNADAKNPQVIVLPFSTLVVNPGTFKNDAFIFIYEGDFDNIKKVLPQGQSPFSSYYLVFRQTNGLPAILFKPISTQSYNNYVNTNTYFYPLASSSLIDKANEKTWQGNVFAKADLPIQDVGFIVAANINLKQDDSSLHPKFVTPAAKTYTGQSGPGLKIIGVILGLVLIGGFIAFLKVSKRRKKQL